MPMSKDAKKAFEALKKINAPVLDKQEYNAQFLLGAELRNSEDRYFADYYCEEVKEEVDSKGEVINAWGIHEDVHKILKKYNLRAEWIDAGLVGIYL